MKKTTYYCLAGLAAFLAVSGIVYAASHDITSQLGGTAGDFFNVQGTMMMGSAKIGLQGVGGVTFFNGTIINDTTTNGVDNPVAFGDNVRIDGSIFRTEIGGDNPLKIADSIKPTTDAVYSLGESSSRFKDAFFSGTLTVHALSGTGIVTSDNIADKTIDTADLATSAVTSAKIANGTISTSDIKDGTVSSADIKNGTITGDDFDTDSNLAVDSLSATDSIYTNFVYADGAYFNGDVVQWDYEADGTVHAAFFYDPTVNSYLSSFGDPAVSIKHGVGDYTFTFSNLNLYDQRFFQITPDSTSNVNCVGTADVGDDPSGKTLDVRCFIANTGAAVDSYMHIAIF